MNFPWNCQSKSCGGAVKFSLRRRWWKGISRKANPLFAHMNAAIWVSPVGTGEKKMKVALHEIRFHTFFAHDQQLLFRYFQGKSSGGHSAAGMPYRHPSFKKMGHLWDCVVWCSMVVLILMPMLKKTLPKMLDWVSSSLVPIQYHISYLPQNRTLPLPSSLLFFY